MVPDLYWALATALSLTGSGIAFTFLLKFARDRESKLKARIKRLEHRLEAAQHHREGQRAILEAVGKDFSEARKLTKSARPFLPADMAVALHNAVRRIMAKAAAATELVEASDHKAVCSISSISLFEELQRVAQRAGYQVTIITPKGDSALLPAYELCQASTRALKAWAPTGASIQFALERCTEDPEMRRIVFEREDSMGGSTPKPLLNADQSVDLWIAEQWALTFGGRILIGTDSLVIEVPVVARGLNQTSAYGQVVLIPSALPDA